MNAETRPAEAGPVEPTVGRHEKCLDVLADPVADALDDMAGLGEHWRRNRDRGRMPNGIRGAMLLVARDVLMLADAEQREMERRFSDMCGPTAFSQRST